MSGIPVRLVLFITGNCSNSEGILHVKLLFWLQKAWFEVVLTTVIPCLEVSLLLIFTGSNVFTTAPPRIVANTTKYSHITPMRLSLHWSPIMHRSVFKTALLVYKILHSGYPNYFEPFIKPRHSVYRPRRSQSDGVLLVVSHFALIYKSKKHFGLSLYMMLQGFGMICLMMYAQPNRSLHSGRS